MQVADRSNSLTLYVCVCSLANARVCVDITENPYSTLAHKHKLRHLMTGEHANGQLVYDVTGKNPPPPPQTTTDVF